MSELPRMEKREHGMLKIANVVLVVLVVLVVRTSLKLLEQTWVFFQYLDPGDTDWLT